MSSRAPGSAAAVFSRCQALHDLKIILATLVARGAGRQLRTSVLSQVKQCVGVVFPALRPSLFPGRARRAHVCPSPPRSVSAPLPSLHSRTASGWSIWR